ncbi:MAG TPA: hypothetical protein PLX56_06775, partial [bacterium]|nr:hypothetical protein [bacterium]
MKHAILIFTLFLFSCTSCNEIKPSNDKESTMDQDNNTQFDADLSDDLSDEALAESEDTESDETDDEVELADVDYQGAEECPQLKYAKFPYYNDDLSIHFCRKCDKPTVKDPQCVENLWKDAAAALYAVAPEAECESGYPCDMADLKPQTQAEWDAALEGLPSLPYRPHECDIVLSARSISTGGKWATDSTAGAIKHFDISDGKVGIKLMNVHQGIKNYTTTSKVMIYNPVEKTYKAVAPFVADMLSFHKGCFIYMGADLRSFELSGSNRYLFYSCEDGRRSVVYPDKIEFISYTPALSEKWAVVNIEPKEGGGSSTMYAKVGTWKWTKLMEGLAYLPEIVNDKAIFYTDSFKGYYCDLSKNPKSVDDCMIVNENESEEIRYPLINEDDETEILYESDISGVFSIKRLKIGTDGKKEYSKLITTHESTDEVWKGAGYPLKKVTNETLYYNETLIENGGEKDGNACFHNRKTKKTVCMKKVEGMEKYYFGFGEWEGKWMVYQFRAVALQ